MADPFRIDLSFAHQFLYVFDSGLIGFAALLFELGHLQHTSSFSCLNASPPSMAKVREPFPVVALPAGNAG